MTGTPGSRALDAAADSLAAWRLIRLAVQDDMPAVAWARDKVIDRSNEHGKGYLAQLVSCPYCMGVWVGAAVVTARAVAPRPWGYAARALAVAAAGTLMTFVDDHLHEGIRLDVGVETVEGGR